RIGDAAAYHGFEHAVFVGGIAPGKTPLYARMTTVGLAVFPGHHAYDFLAFHFCLERAAYAAIGTGGNDGVFGLAHFDDGLFHECRCGASLHAGAAGDTVTVQEGIVLTSRNAGIEAASGYG